MNCSLSIRGDCGNAEAGVKCTFLLLSLLRLLRRARAQFAMNSARKSNRSRTLFESYPLSGSEARSSGRRYARPFPTGRRGLGYRVPPYSAASSGRRWTDIPNPFENVGIIAMAWMVNGIFNSYQTIDVNPVCWCLPVDAFNSALPRFIEIQSLNGQIL